MSVTSIVILVIIVGLLFYIVSIYNKLVALKNRYQNGFSQIEVQLKRRYDLIPNLVETAKAYMSHERETLEAVIAEMLVSTTSERQGRVIDHDPSASMEKKKQEGYF